MQSFMPITPQHNSALLGAPSTARTVERVSSTGLPIRKPQARNTSPTLQPHVPGPSGGYRSGGRVSPEFTLLEPSKAPKGPSASAVRPGERRSPGLSPAQSAPALSPALGLSPVDHGYQSVAGVQMGHKKENQDSLFFQPLGGGDFAAGVCDGHGRNGGRISKWTAERLQAKLQFLPLHPSTAESVLVDLFQTLQADLQATAAADSQESGTTAVVCVKRGVFLFVANVGDSRCVLGRMVGQGQMGAVHLTSDHTPARPDEQARILRAGGVIARGRAGALGPQRVYNPKAGVRYGLCVTRSIGDTNLASAGVVPRPEVLVHHLGGNDKFVLLASDGVWAVMSSEEAAVAAGRVLDPTKAAGEVVAATMAAWGKRDPSYRDDVTALVIKLRS